MKEYKPVIVVIGYNRIAPLKRLLYSLLNAEYSCEADLVISLDYGGGDEILKTAKDFEWPYGKKIVRSFETNQGLKKHVLSCIDYSIDYGAAIILEDDIVVSPCFYSFALEAWKYYENDDRVVSIALYSQKWNGFANRRFEPIQCGYDVYASKKNASWGQCIIGEQWKEFKEWLNERDGQLEYDYRVPKPIFSWEKSWCKYFNYYIDTHDKFVITPYVSLSTNFNNAGTHMVMNNNAFQQPLMFGKRKWIFANVDELIQYDDFCENINLQKFLENKYGKSVCIDYYGLKENREEYDLCLSTAILAYEIYDSFALEMKPYEINIEYGYKGEGIYLYDMQKRIKKVKNWRQHYRIVKYDVCDLQFIDALFYALYVKFFVK